MLPSEAFFFPSHAQSNVYNLTSIESPTNGATQNAGTGKLDLLAAHFRPIAETSTSKECCLRYRFSSDGRHVASLVKSLDFVCVPTDSDIVCLDALYDPGISEYMIAIGIVSDHHKAHVNIYGSASQESLQENNLLYCEIFRSPLQLTHACYLSPLNGELKWAFLLSCGKPLGEGPHRESTEHCVLLFGDTEDASSCSPSAQNDPGNPSHTTHTPPETDVPTIGKWPVAMVSQLFPETTYFCRTAVLYMNFKMHPRRNHSRLSVFGTEDGQFGVFEVDMKQAAVLYQLRSSHQFPIIHLQLFDNSCANPSDDLDSQYLLVCPTFGSSVVYKHLPKSDHLKPENALVLPKSADFDLVTCATVGDLDFDGLPEIALGTFGQRLLFYHWLRDDPTLIERYELVSVVSLIGPVHSLTPPLDLLGDGLLCLAVLTSRGIHVYRHKTKHVVQLLSKRLSELTF